MGAGANYRFGYKAAGDASDLVRLCQEYGLQSAIVDPIMDTFNLSYPVSIDNSSREKGQVSTTRICKALANGDMERVAALLGRRHRILIELNNFVRTGNLIRIPLANVLNLYPTTGTYECSLVHEVDWGDNTASDLCVGQLRIEESDISLKLQDPGLGDRVIEQSRIALEFLN